MDHLRHYRETLAYVNSMSETMYHGNGGDGSSAPLEGDDEVIESGTTTPGAGSAFGPLDAPPSKRQKKDPSAGATTTNKETVAPNERRGGAATSQTPAERKAAKKAKKKAAKKAKKRKKKEKEKKKVTRRAQLAAAKGGPKEATAATTGSPRSTPVTGTTGGTAALLPTVAGHLGEAERDDGSTRKETRAPAKAGPARRRTVASLPAASSPQPASHRSTSPSTSLSVPVPVYSATGNSANHVEPRRQAPPVPAKLPPLPARPRRPPGISDRLQPKATPSPFVLFAKDVERQIQEGVFGRLTPKEVSMLWNSLPVARRAHYEWVSESVKRETETYFVEQIVAMISHGFPEHVLAVDDHGNIQVDHQAVAAANAINIGGRMLPPIAHSGEDRPRVVTTTPAAAAHPGHLPFASPPGIQVDGSNGFAASSPLFSVSSLISPPSGGQSHADLALSLVNGSGSPLASFMALPGADGTGGGAGGRDDREAPAVFQRSGRQTTVLNLADVKWGAGSTGDETLPPFGSFSGDYVLGSHYLEQVGAMDAFPLV